MGQFYNNPIIRGRYDGYGIKCYWKQGYYGQGIKIALIDEFAIEHGHQMMSAIEYVAPKVQIIKLDMKQNNLWNIAPLIHEAIKLGVHIISISRSSDSNIAPLYEAVRAAKEAGIIIFCSAGNDGDNYRDHVDLLRYPAAYEETVSVMSINNSYIPSTFASHNSKATICGFGNNVLVKSSKGVEMLVDGTSAPTATCAGVASLYMSRVLYETGKHPTYDYMMNFVRTNVVDLNEVGKDNFTGYGFFTLDKSEFDRVKMMILDRNSNKLSDRLDEIKSLIQSGVSYEEAERRVSANYYVVGYEVIQGIKVPVYGGRKQ
jgi:subtilisin family serine protease